MVQIAPILQYNGPELDIVGNFAKGQQMSALNEQRANVREDRAIAAEDRQMALDDREKMRSVLSQYGGDYEKAAAELLPINPEMANTILSMGLRQEEAKSQSALRGQQMQMNTMEMAQAKIKQRQEQIAYESKMAQGAFDALQGVQDPEQKRQIYDLYMKSLGDNIELPSDLKNGWSPENERSLGMIAQMGQEMIALDPSNMTANMRDFTMSQQNPDYAEFLGKQNQRDLSGTEAIVEQLRKEDPNLSYADALAVAQGLARKSQTIKDGKVVPLEGSIETASEFKAAESFGRKQGEAVFDLPRVRSVASEALTALDAASSSPGLKDITGWMSLVPVTPGGERARAEALLDQIQGKTFLAAYETLKGGGQITEVEGVKAEKAIAALGRAQKLEDVVNAIGDLRGVIINSVKAKEEAASKTMEQIKEQKFQEPEEKGLSNIPLDIQEIMGKYGK